MVAEEYPKTHQEFLTKFKNEEDCWQYLYRIRWPNGFECPKCNHKKYWLNNRQVMQCSNCNFQISITSGTIFHGTRKPLLLWFNVIWWIMAQKTGTSAQNLKESMGFGSYQTTWSWLHKLRRTMIRPGRDRLKGIIEVDETYIGGIAEGGKRGRGAAKKTLVVVAVECLGKKAGRVRFRCIKEASSEFLLPFINDTIKPGSTIITDGWEGYNGIENMGYRHEQKVIRTSNKRASDLLPHVHLVDSLVKKWINGTHQGNIHPKHLAFYLDEYAFRFNRRLSNYRGKLFFRLIQQSVISSPTFYKNLIEGDQQNKEQAYVKVSNLIQSLNSSGKVIWTLKKIKTVHCFVAAIIKRLSQLDAIKYVKITTDAIRASSELEGVKNKYPATRPYHPTATGIHLKFDFEEKVMEFFELNSTVKGYGKKMVESVLENLPSTWRALIVFNYNPGFWEKMNRYYPSVNWLEL